MCARIHFLFCFDFLSHFLSFGLFLLIFFSFFVVFHVSVCSLEEEKEHKVGWVGK